MVCKTIIRGFESRSHLHLNKATPEGPGIRGLRFFIGLMPEPPWDLGPGGREWSIG